MRTKGSFMMLLLSLAAALTLSSCSGGEEAEKSGNENAAEEHGSHTGMDHSGSGEIPEGLKEAENPKYKVGSKSIINEDHMPGMKGAEATITGAYKTTVYSLSYDPTNGGERVKNHKWVIHEELVEAGDQPFTPGDEVTIDAEHMAGMKGAKAVIDTAEEMNVYMVDFTTADGEKVTNHMWVTESELSPKK